MCVTDRLDMTLAVKVALNPNATNNQNNKVKDSSKLKASTGDKSKIRSNDLEFTNRLETFEIKKKEENAGDRYLLLFKQYSQRLSSIVLLKLWVVWLRNNNEYFLYVYKNNHLCDAHSSHSAYLW